MSPNAGRQSISILASPVQKATKPAGWAPQLKHEWRWPRGTMDDPGGGLVLVGNGQCWCRDLAKSLLLTLLLPTRPSQGLEASMTPLLTTPPPPQILHSAWIKLVSGWSSVATLYDLFPFHPVFWFWTCSAIKSPVPADKICGFSDTGFKSPSWRPKVEYWLFFLCH